MRLISYAQNMEDVMLYRALAGVDEGCYVDVGAAWPQYHSVTKLFYDRGWSGINLEPNPSFLELLESDRSRDVNLGLAAGASTESKRFTVVRETGLSTLVHERAMQHAADGWETIDIDVQIEPLSAILSDHLGDREIHFLKIDAEGYEGDVIAGNDWSRFRPWIVLAEVGDTLRDPTAPAWEPSLLAAGYRFVYDDGLNRFYVSSEHSELAGAFGAPPNPWDDYVPVAVVELEAAKESLFTAEANLRDLTWRLEKERERSEWAAVEAAAMQEEIKWRLGAETAAVRQQLERQTEEGRRREQTLRDRSRHLQLELAESRAAARIDHEHSVWLEARANELTQQLDSLRRHADTLTSSRSWKITRPLRIALSLRAAPGPGLRYIGYRMLGGRLGSQRWIQPRSARSGRLARLRSGMRGAPQDGLVASAAAPTAADLQAAKTDPTASPASSNFLQMLTSLVDDTTGSRS